MIGVAFNSDEEIVKSNQHAYQWDKGQKLTITGINNTSITDAHFTFKGLKTAYVVNVTNSNGTITVNIPDKVLTYGKDIVVYLAMKISNSMIMTNKTIVIPVVKRNMPENYMYDDDETVYSVTDELQAEIQRSSAIDADHETRITALEDSETTLDTRIDGIENDTKRLEELIDIPVTYKQGYINSAGTIVVGDSSASNWKYTSVPIKKGRKYIFWTNTSASAYPAVVKKSNGNVVKIFPVGTYFGQEYIAECDGVLYVSVWKTGNIEIKGEILPEDISNRVDFLYNTLSINNNFEWTAGSYYNSTGSKQSASNCSCMYFKVMKGEKYKISVSGTQLVYPLFLKDSAGTIIDSLPQGTYNDYIYEVTATGRLYISTFTNPARYVRRYVESDFTKKEEYLEKMTNTVTVACYGDSLTQGNQDGSGNTYPKYLTTLLASQCNVINRGSGGDSSREIASRQGGVGLYVKPFTIPATTTAVEIFLNCAYGSNNYFFPARQNISTLSTVYINGVKGKITYSGSASSMSGEHHYYFTRSEAGDAVEITRPTLVKTSGYDSRYYTQIIWAGTNDKPTLEKLKENVIPTIDNMIKFLHSDRYLVVGLTSKNYMSEIADVNEYMKKNYGNKFVNIRDYILEYGLADAGITATTQDTTDISNGEIPSSLRYDSVHFNAKGYQIVANCIYNQGKILGYWE